MRPLCEAATSYLTQPLFCRRAHCAKRMILCLRACRMGELSPVYQIHGPLEHEASLAMLSPCLGVRLTTHLAPWHFFF